MEEVQNYNVPWDNYDVKDVDGPIPIVGTETYKELKQIPQPSVEEIELNPHLAGVTYQRQQCQRCHVAVRGREKRGDYRGMGCSACHILYGNEGIYQDNDPTIDKSEKGHVLTHRIHGTPEALILGNCRLDIQRNLLMTCLKHSKENLKNSLILLYLKQYHSLSLILKKMVTYKQDESCLLSGKEKVN